VFQAVLDVQPDNRISLHEAPAATSAKIPPAEQLDVPMYRIDALVRRAHSLQCTRDGQAGLNPPGEDRKIA
jgi:hypothetical protein